MFGNRLAASLAIAILLIGYPLGLRAEELMAGLGPAIHEKETRGGLTLSEPAPFYERTKQEFRWVRIPCSFLKNSLLAGNLAGHLATRQEERR